MWEGGRRSKGGRGGAVGKILKKLETGGTDLGDGCTVGYAGRQDIEAGNVDFFSLPVGTKLRLPPSPFFSWLGILLQAGEGSFPWCRVAVSLSFLLSRSGERKEGEW